jgi:hypothetical protein
MFARSMSALGRLCLALALSSAFAARWLPAMATVTTAPPHVGDTGGVLGPFVDNLSAPARFDGDLRALPPPDATERNTLDMPHHDQAGTTSRSPASVATNDPIVQTAPAAALMPSPLVSFDAQGPAGNPPDTNGDIGPNHYIQMVNTQFSVYNRSGTLLAGPIGMNTFFSGTGTLCDDHNGGDVIVLYDPYADRWLLSDLAFNRDGSGNPIGPYYQCVAISHTGDPVSGGWYQYGLLAHDTVLNDYPKFGVWPDGYYLSANMGGCCGGGTWVRVWALDRVSMLDGGSANAIRFDLPSGYNSLLPSNARGARPPSGAPNYFTAVNYSNSDRVYLWRFHADFALPANSWFGTNSGNSNPINITVAAYTHPAAAVPQPGTTVRLDILGDRMMYGLQYRYLDGVERLWMNHSVDSGSGQIGIRWYEIRYPNGAASLYQQGTFNNGADGVHRWMGALAVDRFGNMAVGYNAGNGSTYAGIRYVGRYRDDTLGTLLQGETTLVSGTGAHVNCFTTDCWTRWGDYSYMSIDPRDDCTFWLTAEYAAGSGGYHTRVGSFRFSNCTGQVVVDNAADTDTRGCSAAPADCTLRGAINLLNAGGFDGATIQFDALINQIAPTTQLPGFTASRNAIAGNIGTTHIDGINLPDNSFGLGVGGDDIDISGLSFVNMPTTNGYDMRVYAGTRNAIHDSFFGTVPPTPAVTDCTSGGAASRNARIGILVDSGVTGDGSTGNGSVYIYQNTVACHQDGIYLWGTDYARIGENRAGASGVNYIGINSSYVTLANSLAGIVLNQYATGNGARFNNVRNNIILRNGTEGARLYGDGNNDLLGTAGNIIAGNRIGLNGGDGILIENGAPLNSIGGTALSDRNAIYGNGGNGVHILNSLGNALMGNHIGSIAGSAPNNGNGVRIYGGSTNQVGRFCFIGCGSEMGNVISGNKGDGVQIVGGSHDNTLILNLIGTNITGTSAVSNGLSGVSIWDGAYSNQVGLYSGNKVNLIAGNAGYGIYIAGSNTTSNTVEYNDVGVNSGALPVAAVTRRPEGGGGVSIPNGSDGIILWDQTHGNVISGENWIAHNGASGLYVAGNSHHNTFENSRLTQNTLYGAILDGAGTMNNEFRYAAISGNGLDGIGERNGAGNNRWTALSVANHAGLGIDKEASNDYVNGITPPYPVITSVVKSGITYTISGRASAACSYFICSTRVEVYEVWTNGSGYGEGYTYRGSTYTDGNGNWQLSIPAGSKGCFTTFETDASIVGYNFSGEFGPNSCRTFAPAVRRGS